IFVRLYFLGNADEHGGSAMPEMSRTSERSMAAEHQPINEERKDSRFANPLGTGSGRLFWGVADVDLGDSGPDVSRSRCRAFRATASRQRRAGRFHLAPPRRDLPRDAPGRAGVAAQPLASAALLKRNFLRRAPSP